MTVAAEVSADNGSVCIRLSGEIDRANVSAVEEQIRAAVSGQCSAVSVDLANVSYLDSTGKQLLFDLALRLQESYIVLDIIVPFESPIRRLIELSGLQSIAAVVLVHRPDSSQVGPVELVLPAQPWALKNIRHALRCWLSEVGASPRVVDDVLIAVGEACTNVVDHAYGTEGGTVKVHLGCRGRTWSSPSQIRVSGGSRRWEIEDGERCLCAIVPMICGSIMALLARRWYPSPLDRGGNAMTIATVEASADHGAVRIRLSGEIDLENVSTVAEQSAPQCPAIRPRCRWWGPDRPYLPGQCGNTVAFRPGLPLAAIAHCAAADRTL